MLGYSPGGLRLQPVRLVPRFGALGQASPPPTPLPPRIPPEVLQPAAPVAQAVAKAAGVGMAVGGGMVVIGAATAWVGIHTGVKEKGILSVTGWTVGILAGLGSVMTLATIAGLGIIKSAASSAAAV